MNWSAINNFQLLNKKVEVVEKNVYIYQIFKCLLAENTCLSFRFHLGSYTIQNIISWSTSQFSTKAHLLEVGGSIYQKGVFSSAQCCFHLAEGWWKHMFTCYLYPWHPSARLYISCFPCFTHGKYMHKH